MTSPLTDMRLRALVVVQPFESHLRALLPVIRALAALGCNVFVAAPAKLARLVFETYGLPYVSCGVNWPAEEGVAAQLAAAHAVSNDAFVLSVLRDHLCGPQVARTADGLLSIAQEWRPDLIVCDGTDFAGSLVAERLGLPVLRFDNGWTRLLTDHQAVVREALEPHRTALGLPAARPDSFAEALFTPAPRELLLPDLGKQRITSYQHLNPRREGERLPRWINDLPVDVPLIYVSLGSILTNSPEFAELVRDLYQRIIYALSGIECKAVVSVGRDLLRSFSHPPHVRIVASAPQPLLLQAGVRVFVTHTGFSSLREALYAKVPMVFAPLSSDQPENARRCADHGLGLLLQPGASVSEIRQAIVAVLDNSAFADNALRWQRRTLALPPLETALPPALPPRKVA